MTSDRVAAPSALDTAVYRKVTWRLLPFLMLCYAVAYLDRVNIGFARLQMLDDLGFSETIYGLGAGMFFIGYVLFEVPSNVILHRVGARLWIGRIMISWGLVSAAFMFVTSPAMFYALRFLLGVAEAGFYPGIILYLTYWFPSYRRARIIALFMTAIPVSGIIGGPLSGWIMDTFAGLPRLGRLAMAVRDRSDAGHRAGRRDDLVPRRRHPVRPLAERRREAPARRPPPRGLRGRRPGSVRAGRSSAIGASGTCRRSTSARRWASTASPSGCRRSCSRRA